jgi:hypothetical protein
MDLPFASDQFLGVFRAYNTSIWPAQIFLVLLALVAVVLACRSNVPSRTISAILGFLWLWTGIVYHLMFFLAMNPAAMIFGALCVAQGAIFLILGVWRSDLLFHFERSLNGYAGAVLIGYALVVYPVLGHLLGHSYPSSPTFGAPCPTTIFTFGLLLWTSKKVKFLVYLIPFLWSLIGFSAALKLGILEDVGLLLAGLMGAFLLIRRNPPLSASAA